MNRANAVTWFINIYKILAKNFGTYQNHIATLTAPRFLSLLPILEARQDGRLAIGHGGMPIAKSFLPL